MLRFSAHSLRTLVVLSLSMAIGNSVLAQRRLMSSAPSTAAELLTIDQVRAELKLDKAQKAALKQTTDKVDAAVKALADGLSRRERIEKRNELADKTTAIRKAAEASLVKQLNPTQLNRLKQISLWTRGAAALDDDDLGKKLGLSGEQKAELDKLRQARKRGRDELIRGLSDRTVGFTDFRNRLRKLRSTNDKAKVAVLNQEQAAKLAKLKGPEFKLASRTSRSSRRSSNSASSRRIQKRTYQFKAADKEMEYALFVPSQYSAKKKYPLMVALHGLGSNPQQIMRYPGLTDLAERHGYIVVAPMGYNSRGWYGSRGATSRRSNPKNLGELSEKDVMNVLKIVRGEFNINQDRIYLMGHSMGGGGAWHLGLKYPQIWAGLAPIAPAIRRSTDELKKIVHIPVIVVQGDKDRLVPVNGARRWVAKMKELKMDHVYIEVAGGDHVTVAFRNLPKIFDFFNKHTKKRTAKDE